MKQGPEASASKNSTATRTQKILTSNSTFPQPRLFVDRLSGAWSLDFRGSTPSRISRMKKEVKLERNKYWPRGEDPLYLGGVDWPELIDAGQEEKGAGEDEEEGWSGREVKGVKEDGKCREVEEIAKEDGGSG